jgi:MFS family permease
MLDDAARSGKATGKERDRVDTASSTGRAVAPGTLSPAQWHMILLASLGGALEFYDFVIFGVMSPAIASNFFPSSDPLVSQMLAYAGFAIGYLARPVGGIVLSHFGDRFGRSHVFILSVLVISLSTMGMGLVPGYAHWGVAAPLLLLLLRIVQGFCLGGELPGGLTYVVETVPARASFVCGVVFACVNSGVLLATLVNLALQLTLSPAAMAAWGWRTAFLLGGVLGLVAWRLRRSLEETPAFKAMHHGVARLPMRELLARYPVPVLVATAITATTAAFNGLMFVHMPGYLTRVLHYGPTEAAVAQNLGIATMSVALLGGAWLGDHLPRRRLFTAGVLVLLAGSWPWYSAVVAHAWPLPLLLVLAGLGVALVTGVFGCLVVDLFPTRVRYSGVALSYNVSFTAFSGTAPLIATSLIAATGQAGAPALFMAFCALLALLGSLWTGRHGGRLGGR